MCIQALTKKKANTSRYKISKLRVGFRFSRVQKGKSNFNLITNMVQSFVYGPHARLPNNFISDFPNMIRLTTDVRDDHFLLETC